MKHQYTMHHAIDREQAFVRLAAGVALTTIALGLCTRPALAVEHVLDVNQACDLLVELGTVLPDGPPAVAKGDIIKLTADSICAPTFDTETGALLSGDGIAIGAEGVTLDLNGFNIVSGPSDQAPDGNVAVAAEALGLDVENAGVSVGAKTVKVTNTSTTQVSTVANFTANVDFGKAENSSLVGQMVDDDTNPDTPPVFNLRIGESHGGGGIAIDRSRFITIDTIEILDEQPGEAPAGGDNGIDWKRCTGPGNVLKNSSLKAPLAGLRMRGCKGGGMLSIQNSSFKTVDPAIGVGIEFTRDVEGVTLTGNDIGPNGEIGVVVGGNTKSILFNPSGTSPNKIHDNVVCGIESRLTAPLTQTDAQLLTNNTFTGNGANICHK